jgi:very-short-patch-repair endonuclease
MGSSKKDEQHSQKKKKDEQQTLMIDIAGYHVNRMSLNKF